MMLITAQSQALADCGQMQVTRLDRTARYREQWARYLSQGYPPQILNLLRSGPHHQNPLPPPEYLPLSRMHLPTRCRFRQSLRSKQLVTGRPHAHDQKNQDLDPRILH